MKTEQASWMGETRNLQQLTPGFPAEQAQLVLVFGSTERVEEPGALAPIQARYPNAHMIGCTTAGEISGIRVLDNTLTSTAVHFEKTRVSGAMVEISNAEDSYEAGVSLAQRLDKEGLVHAFVLSDGLHINGSSLVAGLTDSMPADVRITGGLAGDADRFQRTAVVWDGKVRDKSVAVVGLYGQSLRVSCASMGGWDPFGPERLITKSAGNILYEFDGQPALDLYEKYLGDHAAGLPASGLLFPLCLRLSDSDAGVVRTILAIDRQDRSLTFAGDVPEGAYARLMKANFDRLIDGANGAAKVAATRLDEHRAELAILISCVGRKLILKQRIEEEVESVRDILGNDAALAGFYSYGEISPFTPGAKCELHNQTMTITALSEL